MDNFEPPLGVSADEHTPAIGPITAAGGFRSANKGGKFDLSQARRPGQKHVASPEDSVILSAVAHVSLLEEEGLSVAAIAADLGLTTETVLTDIGIADKIAHPPAS